MAEIGIPDTNSSWRNRFWRYAPVLIAVLIILIFSNSTASFQNSSRFLGPFLAWLFPDMDAGSLHLIHMAIRKSAHLFEYAILGFLFARAYRGSSYAFLSTRFFAASLLSVLIVASIDETNQALNPTRTGSVLDVCIDLIGGLIGILLLLTSSWLRSSFIRKREKR